MIYPESNKPTIAQKLRQSATFKIITILFLTLLLMIPIAVIKDLIRERSSLKMQIENDIARAYGQSQTIIAPVLKIPYKKSIENSEGKIETKHGVISVTPNDLKVDGGIETDKRKRSIYEIIVYKSELNITGIIELPDMTNYPSDEYDLDYEAAYLSMGISDNNGLFENTSIEVNGMSYELSPGTTQDWLMHNSLSTPIISMDTSEDVEFSLLLKIKGTKSIQFLPVAKNATITLHSQWHSPSFIGSQLPQSHDITQDGFSAKWTNNQYNRSYPHFWFDGNYTFKGANNSFGVNLIEPVDGYGKNNRSSKYALLIISLTFGVFFFFEVMYKKNIHPVQYTMIGFALTTFYLLLISLTEHVGFNVAYLCSAIATISLISGYTQFIIKSKKAVLILFLLLASIFTYIFIILQLEEFALLAGSVGLFIILSMVMFLSRNIDWYNLNKTEYNA